MPPKQEKKAQPKPDAKKDTWWQEYKPMIKPMTVSERAELAMRAPPGSIFAEGGSQYTAEVHREVVGQIMKTPPLSQRIARVRSLAPARRREMSMLNREYLEEYRATPFNWIQEPSGGGIAPQAGMINAIRGEGARFSAQYKQ